MGVSTLGFGGATIGGIGKRVVDAFAHLIEFPHRIGCARILRLLHLIFERRNLLPCFRNGAHRRGPVQLFRRRASLVQRAIGRSVFEVDVQSVKKKMKDKAFARSVNRQDIVEGAQELGVPLEKKILQNVLFDKELKSEQIHPNARGYRRMAQALADFLHSAGAL